MDERVSKPQFDLGAIKLKLSACPDGPMWPRDKCDQVETEYHHFLAVMKAFPENDIIPGAEVDVFWHYRILDTRKYMNDCHEFFGYYLHHFPYLGMTSDSDASVVEAKWRETCALMTATFGGRSESWSPSACGTRCDGGWDEVNSSRPEW